MVTRISSTYSWTFEKYGRNYRSVLWRTGLGQSRRFKFLLRILDAADKENSCTVINDYGCGYGALFGYLKKRNFFKNGRYMGYDVSEKMVDSALRTYQDTRAAFYLADRPLYEADYTLASGTFGYIPEVSEEEWRDYVYDMLKEMAAVSRKGMAFNLLAADQPDLKEGLFQTKPEPVTAFCQQNFPGDIRCISTFGGRENVWLIRFS